MVSCADYAPWRNGDIGRKNCDPRNPSTDDIIVYYSMIIYLLYLIITIILTITITFTNY